MLIFAIFNIIPQTILGDYDNDFDQVTSMLGQGTLAASLIHKNFEESNIKSLIEKVEYKVKARGLMLNAMRNHNDRIFSISKNVERLGGSIQAKAGLLASSFRGIMGR